MSARITRTRVADANNVVHTVKGGARSYRREPCPGCPWRVDNTGAFPAAAFRISASTAYDGAFNMFACHESGPGKPATCAGFLLRNADNNIGARLAISAGRIDLRQVHDGGHELHESYRAMAEANGVDPADPVLAPCRENDMPFAE
jgi:hypothetical protein